MTLIGSSELGRANPERISDNLMLLHEECKRAGAKSIAVTIPEHFQVLQVLITMSNELRNNETTLFDESVIESINNLPTFVER